MPSDVFFPAPLHYHALQTKVLSWLEIPRRGFTITPSTTTHPSSWRAWIRQAILFEALIRQIVAVMPPGSPGGPTPTLRAGFFVTAVHYAVLKTIAPLHFRTHNIRIEKVFTPGGI